MTQYFIFKAVVARRFPPLKEAKQEMSNVETHVLRVRAKDVPAGLPRDANPRDPNVNRQVYRQVRASLLGTDGTDTGSFHLKHSGIVLIASSVERLGDDEYRIGFDGSEGLGVVNGGHSYELINEANKREEIPEDQYVEFKVHVGLPVEAVPDVADGLNTSLQVKPESLANLKGMFDWLKRALERVPAGSEPVAWNEGEEGEYDVREVIALLMALDPTRYSIENPIGLENTYARVSSVFKNYLADGQALRVGGFSEIAPEALALYEYIRYTSVDIFSGKFRATLLDENYSRSEGESVGARKPRRTFASTYYRRSDGSAIESDARLVKPAAIVMFSAFRTLVDVDEGTGEASWKYPFEDVLGVWRDNGDEMLREFHSALTSQYRNNLHYAGRSSIVYKTSTRTLEVADLRRRLAAASK
jgi:hypothetical protein